MTLAPEGSVYVTSRCDVPAHIFHNDPKTSHLKNTVTGKCICRTGDTIVESYHGGVENRMLEWTINDGVIRSYMDRYVEGDLTFVDDTATQWHIADSFEEVPAPVEEVPAPVEEIPAPVEEVPAPVEEVPAPAPVSRANALMDEATTADVEA
jgi:hypothetical protein